MTHLGVCLQQKQSIITVILILASIFLLFQVFTLSFDQQAQLSFLTSLHTSTLSQIEYLNSNSNYNQTSILRVQEQLLKLKTKIVKTKIMQLQNSQFLSKQIKIQNNSIIIQHILQLAVICFISLTLLKVKTVKYSANLKIIFVMSLIQQTVSSAGCMVSNCAVCDFDPSFCDSCDIGYHLDNIYSCGGCSDAFCRTCYFSSVIGACQTCVDTMYWDGASCATCSMSNCRVCNASVCTNCFGTYSWSGTSSQCQTCYYFLTGCANCTKANQCNTCSTGYFMDNKVCSACNDTMNGCTSCTDSITCSSCNTPGFYLQSIFNICFLCSNSPYVSNCQICDSTGHSCSICFANLIVQNGSCVACSSVISNCTTCISSQCTGCQTGYILVQGVSPGCYLCSDILANCTSCTNSSYCTSCDANYFLSLNNVGGQNCLHCSLWIAGCFKCNSNIVCKKCIAGYCLDSTNRCITCSSQLSFCATCQNLQNCTSCTSTLYAIGLNYTCQLCSILMSGCQTCSSSNICTSCSNGNLYYLNVTSGHCRLCSIRYSFCLQCTSNACTKCQTGFRLNYKGQCSCNIGNLVNGLCIDVFGCSAIVTIPVKQPICTACSGELVFIQGQCYCPNGQWLITQICTDIVGCMAMKQTNLTQLCIFCDLSQHFVFNAQGKCQCQAYYELNSTNLCQQICGDGKLLSLACDDGNIIDQDGCSSTCQVQDGFTCTIQNGTSHCIYQGKFSIKLVTIEKIPDANSGKFIFQFTPKNANLGKMNFSKYINLSIPGVNFTITTTAYSDGILEIGFDYGSDMTDLWANMVISFDKNLFKSPNFTLTFRIVTNGPKLTFLVKLQLYKLLQTIIFGLGFFSFILFVLSLPVHKMIGVQTLQTVQMFFMVLLIFEGYEQPFNKMQALKISMGTYNFWKYSKTISIYTSDIYNRLGFLKQFLSNQIIISPISIFLFFVMMYLLLKHQYSQNERQYKKAKKIVNIEMKNKLAIVYKYLFFPIVVGFSFSFFISTYTQMDNNKYWRSNSVTLISIISPNFNTLGIIPFCFSYPIIFACEMFVPLQDIIAKTLLRLQRAKLYYIPMYLSYSLLLIIIFIAGSQQSKNVTLYFMSIIIIVYFIILLKTRPYHQFIHNSAIIVNQTMVIILVISLIYRSIKLQSNDKFLEQDNLLFIMLFITCLILVQIIALTRIIVQLKDIIVKQCKKNKQNPKFCIDVNLKQSILDKQGISATNYEPQFQLNPYLFHNQVINRDRKDWKNINQERQELGLITLQFNENRLIKHQLLAKDRNLKIKKIQICPSILSVINFEQNNANTSKNQELIKLKAKMRQNFQNSQVNKS